MKMGFRYIIFLLFTALQLNAQTGDIVFRRVSPPGGFSFQAVTSFCQDQFGYIWMGSFDGVIRYNSKEVQRFHYEPATASGLPSNTITSVAIDNENNVWATTDKGLCIFNRNTQSFEQVFYTYENGNAANTNLLSTALDNDGRLWIADERFIGFLDIEKNQLNRITHGLNDLPSFLHFDAGNRLWLGTMNGSVYQVVPDRNILEKKIDGPGSFVRTIWTHDNQVWVGYESHGARLFNTNGKLLKHYTYPSNPKFNFQSVSVRKILRDRRGKIWIGTYHGLFLVQDGKLAHFDRAQYDGVPHNSIFDIYEDQQGGIWIGTWAGGVAYHHHADNRFYNFRHSKAPGTISDNMVSSFTQMPGGELFVGTERGGLDKFNVETKYFRKIKALEKEGVLNVKALETDNRGGLWIACAFKGLYYQPDGKKDFIHFENGVDDGKHVSAQGVYALCKSDSGMWIGTNFGGIDFYHFESKKISFKSKKFPFSQVNGLNIRSLAIDSNDNLWIATSDGMYKIHLPTGKSTQFNIDSPPPYTTKTQSFYFVCELSDGNIWMGTRGNGINIYDHESDKLRFFDAGGLLKDNDVYGILESKNNNIWITSNDGLILYNVSDKTSRRFVITDGIQGGLFNPNAIFKDESGNLYFGGTNGFTLLEPKIININSRPPNVLINRVNVNNRNTVPTQTGINRFQEMVLKPGEKTLSFHFSADNFLLPEKNKFQYRLTNYLDQWVEEENNGVATFVNIPAGEYIFEVIARNNDGIWNETPARLPVTIKQFWYQSTLAYSFYIIAFIAITLLIFRFYRERLKLKKALLIEKIKLDHEEQLHEMKLRFFTNISHEFRTPLTLINWPLKNLLNSENLNPEERGQLETVKRNTTRLLRLINQIMDFRKVEKGLTKLNISKIELVKFIHERILNFSEEAKSKNIKFSFQHGNEEFTIEADEEKLDKIIFNLLSNAFKYSSLNGEITITLQDSEIQSTNNFSNQLSFGKLDNRNYAEIAVTDTGQGVESEDLPTIFERYEQGSPRKTKNSTGIGLSLCKDYTLLHRGMVVVQSTPGKGSRFSVRLPLKQKAQKVLYESHEKVKNINSWKSSENESTQTEENQSGTKILVVEDNEELRKHLVKFLESNYSVSFAANGKQGLEILKQRNIQLIISDVMMPEMDGFELCRIVKSQIETSHIPVILLTALSSSENKATGLNEGADAYISKPFDESILLAQIKNLLQQRKRIQESYTRKFIEQQPIEVGSLDNYFLNKVNSTIEKNIQNENFSVDKLATDMGLSRSQLHRKLKQISNRSTSEYITIVRIKKATALLATKNYNVEEAAYETGFNSPSYFAKCFKKIHGQSPKEFLKQL